MNNNLSEEQYTALVRDAMRWRKHCILAEKAEAAIMDHRGHSYWEGYSDGKRDAESAPSEKSEAAREIAQITNRAGENAAKAGMESTRGGERPPLYTFAESYKNGYETAIETAAQHIEAQHCVWDLSDAPIEHMLKVIANNIRALKDAPRPHNV